MDPRSAEDPVERVYNRRVRGLGLVVAGDGQAFHAHPGCWFTFVAGTPSRMVVAIPAQYPGAALAVDSGRLTVSLLGQDQMPVLRASLAGLRRGDEFPPGTWALAPSGVPCLAASPAVFDLRVEQSRPMGDTVLVTATVRGAGGVPGSPNLSSRDLVRLGGVPHPVLPMEPLAWPTRPLPVLRLAERPAEAYARRTWGIMAVVAGNRGQWAGALTTGVVQVAHEPPRVLLLVPPGSALDYAIQETGRWTCAIASPALVRWVWRGREELDGALAWHDGFAQLPEALGLFYVEVESRLAIGHRVAILGRVRHAEAGARGLVNVTSETLTEVGA